MGKSISHRALDAAFEYIASRADLLALCAGAPANAEDALTPLDEGGRMLAVDATVPGLGTGDFAVMPGLISGRRLVANARDAVTVAASGFADHLALVAAATGELLVVTTLAEPCELVEGGTVAVGEFSHEIADPA